MNTIIYIIGCVVLLLQLFLWLFYFSKMINGDNRFIDFCVWFLFTMWYVYMNPLNGTVFSRWRNWVYYYRYGCPTNPDIVQWLCEATPWLAFMVFFAFLYFFYEWSLKNRFDWFLVSVLIVLFLVILTV